MTALLKAMGVMVWSLAAVGLLFIGGVIGFRALRSPSVERPVLPPTVSAPPAFSGQLPPLVHSAPVVGDPPSPTAPASARPRRVFDAPGGRAKLRAAAARRDNESVIAYGLELDETGLAGPEELAEVAIAYYTLGDCPESVRWVEKSTAALAGRPPGPALARAKARCSNGAPAISATSPAPGGPSGDHDVHVGELFYGFNDYARAIDFLRKGLLIGHLRYPDEAYVYLGRSYLAIGAYAEACEAFDALREVPTLSSRVRRLWTLYADMHCMAPTPD